MPEKKNESIPWQDDPVLAAHYTLWTVGEGRYGAIRPGAFAEMLFRAMFHADRENVGRFMKSFPVLMSAVSKYKNEENGYLELRKLAGLQ